jgi:hypothetical protein
MLATVRFSLLSSCLLSQNIKTRIYKNIVLPVGLYGRETWSLTVREEHRLRMFAKIIWTKDGRSSFMICTLRQVELE